jgi:ATP-binding cassette subfamily F protein uup
VFTGDGRIEEHLGGYEHWQRTQTAQAATAALPEPPARPRAARAQPPTRKLSYAERLELEALPTRIEALEAEQAQLESTLSGAEFYKEPHAAIAATLARVDQVREELDAVYRRWDELDSRPK